MKPEGAGAPGTIGADVAVRFDGNPDGTTTLSYDADAVVGGMIGGVGQRMLTSVSRRMAGEFFGNVEKRDRRRTGGRGGHRDGASAPSVDQPATPGPPGPVFTAPAKRVRAAAGSQQDFLTGVAVGAGLVALGVVVGGIFGRRR